MAPPQNPASRAFWLKHLHQWHWISSAICLIGMLLFAATGITLNHAAQIEAKPTVETAHHALPPELLAQLQTLHSDGKDVKAPVPSEIDVWLARQLSVRAAGQDAEWSSDEIYLSLPRPGGDAWLSIDRTSGEVTHEVTTRGWVSYLNDLHKGRNTGTAWSWFIDLFAVACLLFCITGLFLLHFHAGKRPATWPLVALGFVVPVVLAILFIH
jgi:hypothetical protein